VGEYGERSAYLWTRNLSGSSDWQQLGKLTDADAGSRFGSSVALSGSTQEFVIGGQFHTAAALAFFPFQRPVHDARLLFACLQVAPRARKSTQ
jgi:hypothetical protein